MQKRCIKCKKIKNEYEFYFRKNENKYRNECKECTKKKNEIYYKKNKHRFMKPESRIEVLLKDFTAKIELNNVIDKKIYNKILKVSKVWNAKEVLDYMIDQIRIFRDYDENENVNFDYKHYVEELMK